MAPGQRFYQWNNGGSAVNSPYTWNTVRSPLPANQGYRSNEQLHYQQDQQRSYNSGSMSSSVGADQRAYDYRAKMIDRQNEAAPPGQRWYGN
jgi:hypothetical protein